jgi:hypothetical protein
MKRILLVGLIVGLFCGDNMMQAVIDKKPMTRSKVLMKMLTISDTFEKGGDALKEATEKLKDQSLPRSERVAAAVELIDLIGEPFHEFLDLMWAFNVRFVQSLIGEEDSKKFARALELMDQYLDPLKEIAEILKEGLTAREQKEEAAKEAELAKATKKAERAAKAAKKTATQAPGGPAVEAK